MHRFIVAAVLLAGLFLVPTSVHASAYIPTSITADFPNEGPPVSLDVLKDGYAGGANWYDGTYAGWTWTNGLIHLTLDLGSSVPIGRLSASCFGSVAAGVQVPDVIYVRYQKTDESWSDWQTYNTTTAEKISEGRSDIARTLTPFVARYVQVAFANNTLPWFFLGEITLSSPVAHEVHHADSAESTVAPDSTTKDINVIRDGALGGSSFGDGSYVGWIWGLPNITLDFGRTTTFDSITVSALANTGAGIGVPDTIFLSYQKEDGTWTDWQSWTTTASERVDNGRVEISRSFTPFSARYVKYASSSYLEWQFLGEIQLSGDVAQDVHKPVSVESSLPTNWPAGNSDLSVLSDDNPGSATWSDGSYLGWTWDNGLVYLTFDFGQSVHADGFKYTGINVTDNTGEWMATPINMFIRYQTPDSNWTAWETYDTTQAENPANGQYSVCRGVTPFDAQHVQITWGNRSQWAFAGEVQLYTAGASGGEVYHDPSPVDLGDAKRAVDGTRVNVTAYVSAKFGDHFYIETSNRISGIRVNSADDGLALGQQVKVVGTITTLATGERGIVDATPTPLSGSYNITPLGMINRTIGGGDFFFVPGTYLKSGQQGVTGGFGVSNMGLLVQLFGKVQYVDDSNFTVDDGSGAVVAVKCPVGTAPYFGYCTVKGVSSCYSTDTEIKRLVEVSSGDDIRTL